MTLTIICLAVCSMRAMLAVLAGVQNLYSDKE